MRDAVFLLMFTPMPLLALWRPWIGLILWVWLSLVQPHGEMWSFAAGIPYVQIMAIATLFGLAINLDRLRLRIDLTNALIAVLAVTATVSLMASMKPDLSWPKWEEFLKNFLMVVLFGAALVDRVRVHTGVWLLAGCLGYHGAIGGALFIISAGSHNLEGPPGSAIADRNQLALALVMTLPVLHYLWLYSANHLARIGLLTAIAFTVLAVLGTYSRGGFIGLVAMGGVFWLRSRGKVRTLLLLAPIVLGVAFVAPDEWLSRIRTIETADTKDHSFRTRLLSWQAHLEAAKARPLTGAGIYAFNDFAVFNSFVPQEGAVDLENTKGRAAHSIYFQVLGEMGVIAFAAYVALILVAIRNSFRIISLTRGHIGLVWMGDLARACQASLAGFLVAGAAVSMAFYELYLLIAVLLVAVRAQAERAVAATGRPQPTLTTSRPRWKPA